MLFFVRKNQNSEIFELGRRENLELISTFP